MKKTLKLFMISLMASFVLVLSCQLPLLQAKGGIASSSLGKALSASIAPEFPYAPTNYDEPYRGQFHFTPQGGWMNDVNGLWYYNGVYYMTFQHNPHSLAWSTMHWGMATSPDMIHWTQKPIALEPGVNVPGACFSGSVVVDTNNTSGLRTGSNPVFVAVYTATTLGTCLAYSNDLGATWQAYSANPVNVAGPNESTRDPHVFWYAPGNKWVCVIYENGTTFYSSTNLKNWTKTGNFNFGFECPDIFELAIDGGSTKKWVVMDAITNYYIGSFNGSNFSPEAGPFKMDQNGHNGGGGFYASQTFFRNNFPDNRVIQLGWQTDNFGSTWTNNASFPCEIKLVTIPGQGVRTTRTPITEISNLASGLRTWGNQTIDAGSNLLSGINSKCFDITAVFDLSGATASVINFNFPNVTVAYDLANHRLFGQPLDPINNQIKIRILVDWSELEIFGNDGGLSYTTINKFSLSDSSMSLTSNGRVNLVSMKYNNVNRTWPGTAASSGSIIDDANSATVYSGTWNAVNNDATYNANTCHYGNIANDYVQYSFTATGVDWYGLKNSDLGMAAVYIDGNLVQSNIDCYGTSRVVSKLFSITGLANASHTIQVKVSGTKNASSTGTYLVHDYFNIRTDTSSAGATIQVNDADGSTNYSGTWIYAANEGAGVYLNNDCHISNTANSFFQYSFSGTSVAWYGLKNVDLGMAAVYIDNVLVQNNIDCYSTTRAVNKLFSTMGLSNSIHTIKVVVIGTKNPASAASYLVHDYFAYGTAQVNANPVNDSDSVNSYYGSWAYSANDGVGVYRNNDCHVSNVTGAYVQFSFFGTGVDWYGLKNADLGIADVYLDNSLVQAGIDCYSSTRAVSKLFTTAGLSNGSHTIKVLVSGQKNAASSGSYLVHDYFTFYY